MSLDRIRIQNFTVFKEISFNFARDVNVFIGENGTGKTHLLKLIYTLCETDGCKTGYDKQNDIYLLESNSVFNLNFLANLCSIYMTGLESLFTGDEVKFDFNLDQISHKWELVLVDGKEHISMPHDYIGKKKTKSVFIPAKDMLTHANGLLEMAKKYGSDMPFDKSLLDIIEKAKHWKLNEIPHIAKNIIPKLESIIGGKIVLENNMFYVDKRDGKKVSFTVESEGIKKAGLIWQLLMNENITKNTILLWDEPETNINPKLIPEIVEILLMLARQGVQIFISTHDYFLAKYFEVMSTTKDIVAFHSLYFDKSNNDLVSCETSSKFSTLVRNDILSESINLYEAEIQKVIQ